jgi:predicted transcriptional regulator
MKTLTIGIESYEHMRKRTLDIAKGLAKPRRGEPRVWFTSMESFARVLSDRNRELLKLIHEQQPDSLAELAKLSGRAKSNLSRTLKTMSRYGLVELQEGARGTIIPRFPYSHITLDLNIGAKRGNLKHG